MGKTIAVPEKLKDWIIHTFNRGISPVAILQGMVDKGYEAKSAYSTIAAVIGPDKLKEVDLNQLTYEYEDVGISTTNNKIQTSDRDVNILLKMEKPYILYLDNVLSSEECDQLIQLSKERLKPSTVIDQRTGEIKLATGRTSKGTYFSFDENELISKLEKRISEITNTPVENGEGLQVLKYEVGEEYKLHFDFFPTNKVDNSKGGQRIGTFLLYLNDVEAGGETVFPKVGLSIVPKKGAAVYFHYGNSKDQVDRKTLHASIPVSNGEKWVATKWIRKGKIYE